MTCEKSGQLDGKTFAIGILAVTACVLFVGFLLVSNQPAQAFGQLDRAGDYKMLTQRLVTNRDVLVVADSAAKRVIFYDYDYSRKALEIVTTLPLDELPKPPEPEATPPPSGGRRRP